MEETSSVAYNLGETQTNIFQFYFSVAKTLPKFLASVWQEEENFKGLKRCYIHIYPTSF